MFATEVLKPAELAPTFVDLAAILNLTELTGNLSLQFHLLLRVAPLLMFDILIIF
jgi:hypothetical protein